MSIEDIIKTVTTSLIEIALKILLAIAIYFIGRWIIRRILRILKHIFEKHNVDTSLRTFLDNLVSISLTIILFIIIIGVLGLNTSSFIAIFASAGLAIGMALSGTLQNFAGGVMLLLLKPYHVGDYIEAQGQSGTVKSIQLFNTIINTPDNKTIIIPNGGISTGIINNYSKETTRRVEWIIGIEYGNDFDQAKTVIKELLDADTRILQEPAYLIEITQLADSAVNIVVRAWVNSSDYWNVFFEMNAKIYKTLPQRGINFPFPQMDIHLKKD
ncbi:MAG TPA: mechanosensitive ion channel [Candidatus Avirikenella pullistercoris]|nr:mechanosensitive ion channel [Candidatus Avirikenella pullistercoris]